MLTHNLDAYFSEFAKISNSTEADSEAAGRERQLVEVDLERLVEDVAKSCWTRTRQNAAVAGDSDGNVSLGTTGAGGKVDVVIEMDQRLDGWRAMVDVGAIKRVLLNILGNALKVRRTRSCFSLRQLCAPIDFPNSC